MLQQIASNDNPTASRASNERPERERLVAEMAAHLVAGILGGLNSASDIDVIDYLWRVEQRYPSRVILNHMEDAMLEAKQQLIAMEMSR